MQQLNLIDARLLPPPLSLSAARLAMLALAALVALNWHWHSAQGRLDRALAASGVDIGADADAVDSAAGPVTPAQRTLVATIAQRRALRDQLVKADDRPIAGESLLRELIAALPQSIWLTEVDLRGRQSLRIAGGTLDPVALRAFADRLGQIEPLSGVALETVRLVPEEVDPSLTPPPPARHVFELASTAYMARGGDEP